MTPIWECIVCGTFGIRSTHSKQSALQEIAAIWPQSLNLLTYCMNLFAIGEFDGQIFPGITATSDILSVDYYLRLKEDETPEVLHRLLQLSQDDPQMYTPPLDSGVLRSPDLTGFQVQIPLSDTTQLSRLNELFATIKRGRQT